MKTFLAFTKKELLEQYRSGKLLFLGILGISALSGLYFIKSIVYF